MEIKEYKVLGVMSGTSLDGVDIALVHFTKSTDWDFKILKAETIGYDNSWKEKLGTALNLSPIELMELDDEYTNYLGDIISKFVRNNRIEELDAICSHGHTIKHEPENGLTLQIGNLPHLAELVDELVICDFRVQDVGLGGQGAPLVPIGDELLFAAYTYCVNLGGFANISTNKEGVRIAYDICAVNTVLNYYSEKLGKEYDDGGTIARSGKFNPELYKLLEGLPFYKLNSPKSLGIEWVNNSVLPILKDFEEDIPALLNTYCQHIASEIAKNIKDYPEVEVLFTGGGVFNTFLMELLQHKTTAKLTIPSSEIINFKEAVIFGFLGVLKLREEINVLSSVTGAENDHCAGIVYEP
ncbi:anhydro-N-acetylmuramic acid kinase [Gillisia mitskevichiae]|uniref:Anhydro-N-acetylmuramic acid kinase n=1 Tax=Gillisia mitskevichiae TaxID=270921 RepID=A0A495P609_9FLAO|nr:anhydro-N-acetylmuramic acid kinase [Gillisia mitskevichiae]RKS44898.1 anhydro-N-acetylmuramic acid kinase [Gillisia mitskevichiae]